MKRLLIDQKKLDQEAALLLSATYPDGYGDEDIISFKKPGGEVIQAVELKTEDIIYLVKINSNTSHFISHHNVEEEADTENAENELPHSELDLDPEEEARESSEADES